MQYPEPYNRIALCVGRRSLPEDWPKFHDIWDAYDEHGEYLLTLDYQAINQILGDPARPWHPVTLEYEDDPEGERTIVVTRETTLELTYTLDFGNGIKVVNPERLIPRRELSQVLADLHRKP